jgi:cytochrome c-type biogenesis protein CcmH
MSTPVVLTFGVAAVAAATFVAWPAWRAESGGLAARLSLVGAVTLFVISIGGGAYYYLGTPYLAERTFIKPLDRDYVGQVAAVAESMRKHPQDIRGWVVLGRGYDAVRDPTDAARAYARAIQVAGKTAPAGLYSLYGVALVQSSGGEVVPEAAAAFERAIAIDPHDIAGRYYLGLMHAQKRETDRALTIWRSLLADAPKNAPWRGEVLNRVAMLSAGNGVAPNVEAMVSGLAARLKDDPNDAEGWQRLVRAYVVLGRSDKASEALKDARTVLAKNSEALKALDAEAAELKLDTKQNGGP